MTLIQLGKVPGYVIDICVGSSNSWIVVIKYDNGRTIAYKGFDHVDVCVGDRVREDDIIGSKPSEVVR